MESENDAGTSEASELPNDATVDQKDTATERQNENCDNQNDDLHAMASRTGE